MKKTLKYLFHFIMTMEIVKNNKGGSKLCFKGYTYMKISGMSTSRLCPVVLVPIICVRHGTEDSVVLSEHPTLQPRGHYLRSEYEKSPYNYVVTTSEASTKSHPTTTWSLPQKRVRKVTKQLQDRLFNLCQTYYNDDNTLIQTLKGIGHHHQMEVTLICYMCKYQINLFLKYKCFFVWGF